MTLEGYETHNDMTQGSSGTMPSHEGPGGHDEVLGGLKATWCDAVVFTGPGTDDVHPIVLCEGLGTDRTPSIVIVLCERDPGRKPDVWMLEREPDRPAGVSPSPAYARAGEPSATARGRIVVDKERRTVQRDGVQLPMSRLQFDLLAYLMERPGHVVKRQEIFEQVWHYPSGSTATVTVHIGQLRRKIERDPSRPVHLITVRGIGYRYDP